jgi:hypothetical protein
MVSVSRAARHPDGRQPIFGDNDSGRVLPAGFDRPPTHDPLLWLGAALLGERRPLEGPPHPEVAWTLGLDAWRAAGELAAPERPAESAAFPDGGLYVLGGGGTHLVARCGGVGQRGNGGHAHNDLLSFELSREGVPLVVDSGNYAYTFDIGARNEGRSTRAHNTIAVDGEEINPIPEGMAFKLAQVATPKVIDWSPDGDEGMLSASHDGYDRLPGSPTHRRTFRLERRTGELTVLDEVTGAGEHTVEAFLHLAPGVQVQIDGSAATVRAGELELAIEVDGPPLELREGWVSASYGTREPAPVLVTRLTSALPIRLATRIGSLR